MRELQDQLVLQQARNAQLQAEALLSTKQVQEESNVDPSPPEAEPGWFKGTPEDPQDKAWFRGEPTEQPQPAEAEEEAQEKTEDISVDLSTVRLLEEQVVPARWGAAIEIQALCRGSVQAFRWHDELLASDVLTRVIRRFLVRHRLKMQFEEVRKEAIQISRTQMLECEKVYHARYMVVCNSLEHNRCCAVTTSLKAQLMSLWRSGD